MKPEIYPEFLPINYRRAPDGTVTDRIVNAIKEDTIIQYIDLKNALLDAKKDGCLYALTDNHWNWLGAFYAYNEIILRLRKDFPALKPLASSDFYFKTETAPPGNLAVMIGLSKYLTETQYYPVFNNARSKSVDAVHKKPDWAAQIDNYERVKTTGDATLPSAVIIHDSFTDAMMIYFDEAFRTSTYIFDGWRYERNEAIVDDVKPEIVLLIIFEPHISHLAGVW